MRPSRRVTWRRAALVALYAAAAGSLAFLGWVIATLPPHAVPLPAPATAPPATTPPATTPPGTVAPHIPDRSPSGPQPPRRVFSLLPASASPAPHHGETTRHATHHATPPPSPPATVTLTPPPSATSPPSTVPSPSTAPATGTQAQS